MIRVKVFRKLTREQKLEQELEEAGKIIARYKDVIENLKMDLVEVNNKFHQLERAVNTQSACWMCSKNKICHQGATLPQSPDVGCGNFNFEYRKSEKHSETVCDYKHGKMCWAQKGAPECVPEFCPVKEKKEEVVICFNGASQQ